jgi:pimeloyl-[acyl-carrier protein] methyl ester esterase
VPTLHVETDGSGPDLVLLHGWGFDQRVWGGFGGRLAERFRVHRVDLPGHGRSRDLPFNDLAAVAGQVASATPRGSTVCGWSLGGSVALQLARMAPAHVGRLVLVATTPCFVAREDWGAGMPANPFRDFRERFASDRDAALRRFAGLIAVGSADYRERYRQLAAMTTWAGPDATGLDAALAALLETDLRDAVASLAPPALVIQGGRDGLVPVAAAQWLAARLAARKPQDVSTQFELLPDAGHSPFIDAPEHVANRIAHWHG